MATDLRVQYLDAKKEFDNAISENESIRYKLYVISDYLHQPGRIASSKEAEIKIRIDPIKGDQTLRATDYPSFEKITESVNKLMTTYSKAINLYEQLSPGDKKNVIPLSSTIQQFSKR